MNRKDLNDLIASPSHDLVHCFVFDALFFLAQGIRLRLRWLVPCIVVVVRLTIRVFGKQALSFSLMYLSEVR